MARTIPDRSEAAETAGAAARRIREFLDTCHGQSVDTADMARAAGCSRRTLARVTRSHWDCTPREVIARYRIQKACDLLCQGWKVEAAALAVGYRSRIHFYRAFHRHTGTTPGEYRGRLDVP